MKNHTRRMNEFDTVFHEIGDEVMRMAGNESLGSVAQAGAVLVVVVAVVPAVVVALAVRVECTEIVFDWFVDGTVVHGLGVILLLGRHVHWVRLHSVLLLVTILALAQDDAKPKE